MPRSRIAPIARTLLTVLSLAALVAHPDRALCIGVDGHLAVESAPGPEGECCPEGDSEPDKGAAWTGNACGPCHDVTLPLWTVTRAAREDRALSSPLDAATAAIATIRMPASSPDRGPAPANPAPNSARSPARGTTVLRC